ncbi:hypothetical protein VNO80_16209 [Phaseolus coccineus]|uniref:Pentatricopeptide repeat-containing protein n=1 Tax=Phaseolus coccineus TaxID=3886 RepID=A0AAN9R3P6_PHACN
MLDFNLNAISSSDNNHTPPISVLKWKAEASVPPLSMLPTSSPTTLHARQRLLLRWRILRPHHPALFDDQFQCLAGMAGSLVEGGSARCHRGADDHFAEAAGEEEPPWTEVAKLAVSQRHFPSQNRKMDCGKQVYLGEGRTYNAKELCYELKTKCFVSGSKSYNSLMNSLALGGEIEEAVNLWKMTDKQRSLILV